MSIIEKAVNKLERAVSKPDANGSVQTPKPSVARTAPVETPTPKQGAVKVQSTSAESAPSAFKNFVEIPVARLSASGMVSPDSPRSTIAEEYRSIKRPLLMNINGQTAANVKHPNLIMVASSLSGEGKTFSAINLAMSIAMEQDKSVLFIDADVSKASAGRMLGIDGHTPGLTDLLLDNSVQVKDVLVQTNISNLRILPAGNVHERATELLASENMKSLMQELAERYSDRVVVFDSPPLL